MAWLLALLGGAVYLPTQDELGSAIVSWPETQDNQPLLDGAALKAYSDQCAVTIEKKRYGSDVQRVCDLLSCPITIEGSVVAVFACGISARSESQRSAVLQLMQWGALWLGNLIRQQAFSDKKKSSFISQLLEGIFAQQNCHSTSIEIVNRLADQLGCERVSLGLRSNSQIRLRALSHLTSFDTRSDLVRQIESVMEEAVDQKMLVASHGLQNGAENTFISRAHKDLAARNAGENVYSIPLLTTLKHSPDYIGVITLERKKAQPLNESDLEMCKELAGLVGPLIELRMQHERTIQQKVFDGIRHCASTTLDTGGLKLKVGTLVAMLLIAFFSIIEGNYQITAPASIEAAARQLLVAPQDGFVSQSKLSAGDLVKKGQLIALLEDRNLLLEQQKWQSEYNKLEMEYQQALAMRDRSQLSILQAKQKQINVEVQLIEEKIARTRLLAPFDGVILSGDLSQSLGAPVSVGDVLYEIAPVDSYRVTLEVDEFDMKDINIDRSGRLILSAFPQQTFGIQLERVIPLAFSAEGRNFFKIQAAIVNNLNVLRPGMQGVVKIDMGQRNLLWIWTHAVFDRIAVWAWSVGL